MVKLILGRDGMGSEYTSADFDHWVGYVSDRIDEKCGFPVEVSERSEHDIQDDKIQNASDEERVMVEEAKQSLWDLWCSEGVPES
jgi:hypothetical protein